MKHYSVLITFAVCSLLAFDSGAQGTAFTYQGRLNNAGNPATRPYDLRLAICDSSNRGTGVGARPVRKAAFRAENGLFQTALGFGGNGFTAANPWLEVAVPPQGGALARLSPRKAIRAIPYAAF